jgi:sarcosine oxidase subunit gamma
MSEALSALPNAQAKGTDVTVAEVGLQGMITLRGDLSGPEMAAALSAVSLTVPEQRQVVHSGDKSAAWMSPDELLVLLPYTEVPAAMSTLTDALADSHALVANVSDARAMFRITGTPGAVRDTLAKVAPADLSPEALAPGEMRRTRMAQMAAAFWLTEEGTGYVVCFRSVAEYAFGVLKTSAVAGPVGFFH